LTVCVPIKKQADIAERMEKKCCT